MTPARIDSYCASPLASIMASCSLPHLAPCKPKIRIASHRIAVHPRPLVANQYRRCMQPVAHASDMNPNNGRRCCAAVPQSRVSLDLLVTGTLSPPPKLPLTLLALQLAAIWPSAESSPAESAQRQRQQQ